MGQLTVRNLDDAVVAALKARAARHGRSTEAEHRLILRDVLLEGGAPSDWFAAAARLRGRLGRATEGGPDSTALIRADRDRDDRGAPEEGAGEGAGGRGGDAPSA